MAIHIQIPGTASVYPEIQILCRHLQASDNPELHQDKDWDILSQIYTLHGYALHSVDQDEQNEFLNEIKTKSKWWWSEKSNEINNTKRLAKKLAHMSADYMEIPQKLRHLRDSVWKDSGIYVLLNKSIPKYRIVVDSGTQTIINHFNNLLQTSFNGHGDESNPIHVALLLTKWKDWNFYFVPNQTNQEHHSTFNELILQLDTLWPNGFNQTLQQTPLTMQLFPSQRQQHQWETKDSKLMTSKKQQDIKQTLASMQQLLVTDLNSMLHLNDPSQLYRYDQNVGQLYTIIQVIKSRLTNFEFVDLDSVNKLNTMIKILSDTIPEYRPEVRKLSNWWCDSSANSKDGLMRLDPLAYTMIKKLNKKMESNEEIFKILQVPGVYIMEHSVNKCFKFVSKPCQDILTDFRTLLQQSYDGNLDQDIDENSTHKQLLQQAIIFCTKQEDWNLQIIPFESDDPAMNQTVYNAKVIELHSMWPNGANFDYFINHKTLPQLRISFKQQLQC